MSNEYLLLKWGSLKGWNLESRKSVEALEKFYADPVSESAIDQHNTDGQKEALCELIDVIDGPITNDWSGESMTKEEAKKYVMEYDNG